MANPNPSNVALVAVFAAMADGHENIPPFNFIVFPNGDDDPFDSFKFQRVRGKDPLSLRLEGEETVSPCLSELFCAMKDAPQEPLVAMQIAGEDGEVCWRGMIVGETEWEFDIHRQGFRRCS